MMRFAPTTDSLKVVTSAAQAIDCDVSFLEDDAVADTVLDGSTVTAITTATTTTVMAAGAANKSRRVQYASFINIGSALNTITINKDVSGTLKREAQANLAPGEALRFHSNRGWVCYDADGREKVAPVGSQIYATNALTQVILSADVVNNNAVANTAQDVTGLSFGVNAGESYYFKAIVRYETAVITTGSRWSVSGPAFTQLSYNTDYPSTTAATRVIGNYNAYDQPAAATTASAATTGMVAIIEGFVTPSAAGTIVIRFASEVASSAITAKAGSRLQWIRVL